MHTYITIYITAYIHAVLYMYKHAYILTYINTHLILPASVLNTMLANVLLDESEHKPGIVVTTQDKQANDVLPLARYLPRFHRQKVELHVVLGGVVDVVPADVFAGASRCRCRTC